MREAILNHASLRVPNQAFAIEWLKDMAAGLSVLMQDGIVTAILRASYYPHEIYCLPDWSFDSALWELQRQGAQEEFGLLIGLSTKVPLLSDASEKVVNRFQTCEQTTLVPKDGAPLMYCAITDSIAIGFPSHSMWDQDQISVEFEELLPNGAFANVSETIDNLVRSKHAYAISDRHRHRLREEIDRITNGMSLWKKREEAFPHLAFGPDVEHQLTSLNPAELGTVITKLAGLDESVTQWAQVQGPAPPWRSKVTDETLSVKSNPSLRETRRFRSKSGTQELFMWHARFGSSGRIHLRFDGRSHEVEIGYIGQHLPN